MEQPNTVGGNQAQLEMSKLIEAAVTTALANLNLPTATTVEELKALMLNAATKSDLNTLEKRVNHHEKQIRTLGEQIKKQDGKIRADVKSLVKDAIGEATRQIEQKITSIAELMNQRDQHYLKRAERLDERLTQNEHRTAELTDEIHAIADADADTRLRMEQVIPSLHKALFGDPAEKRPGVITTLETTNTRIDQMRDGFTEQLGIVTASLKPMIDNHRETAARNERAKARRERFAALIFSKRGMAAIGAALPFVVPWAIRWIQVHINLHPALLDMLNQISQIVSTYAGK